MKIVFFGTAEFSARILEWILHDATVEVLACVSQADKPVWRKKEILPTAVKSLAFSHNIPVFQPDTLKNNQDFYENLASLGADFFVVVAYGKIIPQSILDIPKFMSINIHGSLLPKYRGASPIQESIKNGDSKTWMTIMQMSAGMDEWAMLSTLECPILHETKTLDVFEFFSEKWPELLIKTLKNVKNGNVIPVEQDHSQATYCGKIWKEDGQVFFDTMSWINIYNTWKAYHIWPGIFSYYFGKKLEFTQIDFEENSSCLDDGFEVWDVVEYEDHGETHIAILTQDWLLILEKVKLEWKKEMDILDFVNGNKNFLEYNFVSWK